MHEYHIDTGLRSHRGFYDSIQDAFEDYPNAMIWRADGTVEYFEESELCIEVQS